MVTSRPFFGAGRDARPPHPRRASRTRRRPRRAGCRPSTGPRSWPAARRTASGLSASPSGLAASFSRSSCPPSVGQALAHRALRRHRPATSAAPRAGPARRRPPGDRSAACGRRPRPSSAAVADALPEAAGPRRSRPGPAGPRSGRPSQLRDAAGGRSDVRVGHRHAEGEAAGRAGRGRRRRPATQATGRAVGDQPGRHPLDQGEQPAAAGWSRSTPGLPVRGEPGQPAGRPVGADSASGHRPGGRSAPSVAPDSSRI